jgi:hypothetical protein
MPFQLSPGVNVSEIDLTTIVPAVGTTEGALVGRFNWGPVNQVVTISNEVELVSVFGKPDANTFIDFFTAANFLSYARNLKLVRTANVAVALNASDGLEHVLVANKDDYELSYQDLSANAGVGFFASKFPGVLGNGIKVGVWASANTTAFASLGIQG